MKSLEEILASGINLQEFENERQIAFNKNKKNLMLAAIVGGAITILGIVLLVAGGPIGTIIILIGIITFFVWWGVANASLKKNLKQKIYSNLANKFDTNLQYVLDNKGLSQMFRKSGLVKGYTSVTSDDGFKGSIQGVSFTMVETKAEQKSNKSSVTVFRGPFYYLTTNQQYPYTSIIPDTLEGSLGKFGASLQKANLSRLNQKLIRIEEDPNFEKMYAVWTKDEVFARKVLTPQLRVFLLTINNPRFYLGFRENFIFMGLDTRQDLFEIKLKEPINQDIVRKFYNDFMTYYSILEQIFPLLPLNAPIIQQQQQQQQPPQPPKF